MYFLEKISNNIAEKISAQLKLDEDREEVIAYGALNLIHTLWSALLLVVFGLLCDTLIEIILISMTAALLRQFSGGAHASSPGRCSFITVTTFGVLSLTVKYIPFTILAVLYYQLITSAIIIYNLYKKSPLDTPGKPLDDERQKRRLRKTSFVFIFFIYIITAVLWFFLINNDNRQLLPIIASLHTGLLWQSILLSRFGNSLINKFDYYLKIII